MEENSSSSLYTLVIEAQINLSFGVYCGLVIRTLDFIWNNKCLLLHPVTGFVIRLLQRGTPSSASSYSPFPVCSVISLSPLDCLQCCSPCCFIIRRHMHHSEPPVSQSVNHTLYQSLDVDPSRESRECGRGWSKVLPLAHCLVCKINWRRRCSLILDGGGAWMVFSQQQWLISLTLDV